MKSVSSPDIILGLIQKIKQYRKGYYTNFFLDIPKIQLWISLQLIEYEEMEETVFLLRKNSGFINLFFITTGISEFSGDIDHFLKKYPDKIFVIDLVGSFSQMSDIQNMLQDRGFYNYTTLVRMNKINSDHTNDDCKLKSLSYADKLKGFQVFTMLRDYFDPYAEQLPLIEEIYKWTADSRIITYSDDLQTIQGFLIFDLTGQTSYLRYWFVHPEHREKKIGSTLIRSFFYESRDTKRKLFWVIESNENAIKRYEHYGFKREELFDYVMINKNMKYE